MAALEGKLAEAVRPLSFLYDKSCRDFRDNNKRRLAWEDNDNNNNFILGPVYMEKSCPG